jgi:hypothetical protein
MEERGGWAATQLSGWTALLRTVTACRLCRVHCTVHAAATSAANTNMAIPWHLYHCNLSILSPSTAHAQSSRRWLPKQGHAPKVIGYPGYCIYARIKLPKRGLTRCKQNKLTARPVCCVLVYLGSCTCTCPASSVTEEQGPHPRSPTHHSVLLAP